MASFTSRNRIMIGAASLFLIIAAAIFYFAQAPRPAAFLSNRPLAAHYADNPAVDLSFTGIKVFYFTPRDLQSGINPSWPETLRNAAEKIAEFYEFQMHRSSDIGYDLYPSPVVGENEHSFYDGTDTSRGNHHALISVRDELLRRAFTPNGDLYVENFASRKTGFEVIAIIYEGVGASATVFKNDSETSGPDVVEMGKDRTPALLVSSSYLFDPDYRDHGLTVLAHEFGHTLGLTEGYDLTTQQILSDDVMGAGRLRPLTITYLSPENKNKLGLPY